MLRKTYRKDRMTNLKNEMMQFGDITKILNAKKILEKIK